MPLPEIANAVVTANRTGKTDALLDSCYADTCISAEAVAQDGGGPREVVGLDAIRAKHAWWASEMETIEGSVEGPYLHGEDRFAVIYKVTVRARSSGREMNIEEVAVYTVADDRIVREDFFCMMQAQPGRPAV